MGVDPNHHLPLSSSAAAIEAHQSTATRNNSIQQYYTDVDEKDVSMDVVGWYTLLQQQHICWMCNDNADDTISMIVGYNIQE